MDSVRPVGLGVDVSLGRGSPLRSRDVARESEVHRAS